MDYCSTCKHGKDCHVNMFSRWACWPSGVTTACKCKEYKPLENYFLLKDSDRHKMLGKNIEAMQNAQCARCRAAWKDHWAVPTTIMMAGQCPNN